MDNTNKCYYNNLTEMCYNYVSCIYSDVCNILLFFPFFSFLLMLYEISS